MKHARKQSQAASRALGRKIGKKISSVFKAKRSAAQKRKGAEALCRTTGKGCKSGMFKK